MIKVGTLAKSRRLHLREGVPIKEIERRTGLARNTIRAWPPDALQAWIKDPQGYVVPRFRV